MRVGGGTAGGPSRKRNRYMKTNQFVDKANLLNMMEGDGGGGGGLECM